MRRFVRRIANLYPPRWRERYGSEFEALLEDASLTWRDLLDVAVGALRYASKPGIERLPRKETATPWNTKPRCRASST